MFDSSDNSLIDKLVAALRFLPGVGPKSAQRLAYYLLQHGKNKGLLLAKVLDEAIHNVSHCRRCHTLSEFELCKICSNPKRDSALLCIVESPIDVLAIEQTASYNGFYFVLMGHLSPLDGVGPNEIGIADLLKLLLDKAGVVQEIILATNPTVEGEATAHYITGLVKEKYAKTIILTRIAHGIPMGSELEYIDTNTLMKAISGRVSIDE